MNIRTDIELSNSQGTKRLYQISFEIAIYDIDPIETLDSPLPTTQDKILA